MQHLDRLVVLALDCQTTGATPALGSVLEVGWAIARPEGVVDPPRAHWVRPPDGARVPTIIRQLTGFRDADLESAIDPREAWSHLREAARAARPEGGPVPTVIHFARFELEFLRDLHARFDPGSPFPFEVVCVHAIAERLFPDLPRRGLRPLTGYLGQGVDLSNRSGSHAAATAFVWRRLVEELAARGVDDWEGLARFLETPRPARGRRAFPLPRQRRRELPDGPGVYRFLRSNGDVLYVGKATSLRKRIGGHFSAASGSRNERVLEMLTQARDVSFVRTESALEAALLETDEIKRLAPPYNVHLREEGRGVWFASADLLDLAARPASTHPLGPLPGRFAVGSLVAARALLAGAEPTPELRARAVQAPVAFAPDPASFEEGFRAFRSRWLAAPSRTAAGVVSKAGLALWSANRARELEESAEDAPPGWDPDRVRRHLERAVMQGAHLVRRARWLCLLATSAVAFREAAGTRRLVLLEGANLVASRDLGEDEPLPRVAVTRDRRARQGVFDAARYDRLRVVTTELKRVLDEGGSVAVAIDGRTLAGERLVRLLRRV